MSQIENIITAKEYSLQDVLANKKYTVDFFQRAYSWTEENITQLVFDLTEAFYADYRPGDYDVFKKLEILKRCELYRQISEKIWGEI